MITIGFDTSSQQGAIAITTDGAVVGSARIDSGVSHASGLLPEIDRLLVEKGLTVQQADLFAVGIGPGSYTGTRIGISVAKGISFALGKPLIGVCSLEAMAYRLRDFNGPIAIVLDARMNAFYYAVYQWDGSGMKTVVQPAADIIDRVAEAIPQGALVAAPDMPELIEKLKGFQIDTNPVVPDAGYIALKSEKMLLSGKHDSKKPVLPLYLRPTPAELVLAEKQKKAQS
jgi:tRNA threonylcarbamoyladenosine biosynthesis protein TsaB